MSDLIGILCIVSCVLAIGFILFTPTSSEKKAAAICDPFVVYHYDAEHTICKSFNGTLEVRKGYSQ
jgi:hypothetical protein